MSFRFKSIATFERRNAPNTRVSKPGGSISRDDNCDDFTCRGPRLPARRRHAARSIKWRQPVHRGQRRLAVPINRAAPGRDVFARQQSRQIFASAVTRRNGETKGPNHSRERNDDPRARKKPGRPSGGAFPSEGEVSQGGKWSRAGFEVLASSRPARGARRRRNNGDDGIKWKRK